MWIFTTDGFFSIVHNKHCADDELSVRARSKNDLLRFLGKIGHEAEIIDIPDAEYPYCVQAPRLAVGLYLSKYAMDISYGNFQEACLRSGFSITRVGALFDIWTECHQVWRDD